MTYAIEGGEGEICLNGAAAHKAKVDDIVIIITYANVPAEVAADFALTMVKLDAQNRQLVAAGA